MWQNIQPSAGTLLCYKKTIRLEVCNSVLFKHAILGCDTTYDIYGIAKLA